MTTQKDSRGAEYKLLLYDIDDKELDQNRLIDGDWLKDPRVYKTVHLPIRSNDVYGQYYVSSTGKFSPVMQSVTEYSDGGVCLACHAPSPTPFFVNDGKEYCGVCNEFFDTYAFIRGQAKTSETLARKLKTMRTQYDKSVRSGKFSETQYIKNEIQRLEMEYYEAKESEDKYNLVLRDGPVNTERHLQMQIEITHKLYQDAINTNQGVLADFHKQCLEKYVRDLEKLSIYGKLS